MKSKISIFRSINFFDINGSTFSFFLKSNLPNLSPDYFDKLSISLKERGVLLRLSIKYEHDLLKSGQ